MTLSENAFLQRRHVQRHLIEYYPVGFVQSLDIPAGPELVGLPINNAWTCFRR